MRIDTDCRDADLLAAEVRRLRAALEELRAAADQADAEYQSEIACLRLTDAERKALSQIYDLLNERSRELQAARRIEESTPFVQLAKTVQQMWERLK